MKQNFLSVVTAAIVVALSFLSTISYSQVPGVIRCWSSEFDSIRHANDPTLQTNEEFEAWMKKLIMQDEATPKPKLVINGVYQIPVIVHIIHSGEAVGTGTNLSAATVQSQIDVLNEDFRRIFGTNGYNTHPDGVDTQIEFCLAKRRPNGTAFPPGDDGINRVNRNTQGWGNPPYNQAFVDGTIKPYTIATQGYDAAIYMNFWSVNLSGGLLGYAQFPTTSLGGMSCNPQNVNTDGVVMLYSSIGKSSVTGQGGPYAEGRTATHEIGHWLGLRHIWGDGGCGVDDFCADTPLSDAANFGCPNTNSCVDPGANPRDMVENYMDYTDDLCMNIFTKDQKTRMRLVLENSPIRASLITSNACIPPAVSDASVVNIISPKGDNCPGAIIPTVTIKNRGSSNLTSATINYTIDNGTLTSTNWTGNIAPGAQLDVPLTAFSAPLGIRTIKAYTTLPNGVIDPNPAQDTTILQFAISDGYQPNYTQDFEATTFVPEIRWLVDNPTNDCFEWIGQSCVSSSGVTTNNAAMMPNFGNSSGLDDYLYTPIFVLPCNSTAASFRFNRAYRRRANGVNDRLRVEISEDCGATWNAVALYDQNGTGLQTVTATSNSYWIPGASTDWANVNIDILPYVTGSSKNVQFRFRATNTGGSGGNIYIDDVQFLATTPAEIDVTASGNAVFDGGSFSFAPIATGASTSQTFTITNNGSSNLILTGPINVTGTGFSLGSSFGSTNLAPGASTTFVINWTATAAGTSIGGNVSFGTNDCDEGTFNFQLNGPTSTIPLAAFFTGAPTTICEGSTVTYTDASSGATSWTWSFPSGSPATATGIGPHTVTYGTAGTYDVSLSISDGFTADVHTETNYVTVISGVGASLPISEGFTGATFPPAGWSTDETTITGNTNVWARSATVGNAPTAGNSAIFDNFSGANSIGNIDDLMMLPVSFTGLSSAQLTFDVAYARYDNTTDDQLEVLVSNDCGQSYVTVYSKAGAALATNANTTNAYIPGTWRNETVDLSAFVGSGKVDIIFRNTSDWGNNVYIDNINLTGVTSSATADFTAAPDPECVGQNVTFTNTSVGATSWDWNFGSGATPATATGSGPHVVTYSTAGTKNVSLSVNGGVSTSNQTVTITAAATPTITASGSTTFCAGGSVTLTSSQATGNVWSTGETTQSITVSTAGSYTVTFTNGSGCSATSAATTVTVNAAPSTPTITASGSTTFCAGGSVTLTSSQATGNVWSTGETTQSITVSTAGSYTVTFTNGSGCSATSTATTVTVNSAPSTPTITASGSTTFCAGGSVTLTSNQATGNVWSTGETTQSITVSTAGSYTVTFTNGSGCSATSAATTVTVNAAPSAPTITASGSTTFCSGGSVTLTSSQATGNVWSTGETTQSITVSTAGSYTVTFTNGSGCSATSAATTVTVNSTPITPTITASGSTTFCAGGSVTLTSSQATGNVWSTGETTQSITVSTAGSYTVTFTNGSGCSASSAATTVTVNAAPSAPTIIASGSTTFCAGGSVTLTSDQASGNVWSTGETTQSITVSTAGSYTVTFTNGSGCSASSAATTVTVNAAPSAPTIIASGSTTFCAGGSVTLTSDQASGNVWSTGETTQSITVSTAGSYTVIFTNGSGCSATSAATTVTVNAAPSTPTITTSGSTTFCAGGSVTLTSSQATGNVWSTGATTQSITVSTAGSYTVTFTNGSGCSATSAAATVTVNALPNVSAGGDQSICTGDLVTLSGSGAQTYSWDNGVSDGVVFSPAGTNTYTVIGTDVNGCTGSDVVVVTVNPLPVVSLTASLDTTCSNSSAVTLTGTPAGGTYLGTGVTGNQFDPGVSGVGSFTQVYDYTDPNGCSGSATFTIVVENCLGLEEGSFASLAIYPNPMNTELTILLDGWFSYDLVDASGRLVAKGEGTNEIVVNTSTYEMGVYFVNVYTSQDIATVRVLKQ